MRSSVLEGAGATLGSVLVSVGLMTTGPPGICEVGVLSFVVSVPLGVTGLAPVVSGLVSGFVALAYDKDHLSRGQLPNPIKTVIGAAVRGCLVRSHDRVVGCHPLNVPQRLRGEDRGRQPSGHHGQGGQ